MRGVDARWMEGGGGFGGRVRDEMQGGWREDVESEKEEDMGVVEWVGVDRGKVHARNLLPLQ